MRADRLKADRSLLSCLDRQTAEESGPAKTGASTGMVMDDQGQTQTEVTSNPRNGFDRRGFSGIPLTRMPDHARAHLRLSSHALSKVWVIAAAFTLIGYTLPLHARSQSPHPPQKHEGRHQIDEMEDAFFFSSRRRHTRWTGDWSSDVCSSD